MPVTYTLTSIDRSLRLLYALCAAMAAVSIVAIAVLVAINVISRLMGVFVPGMTDGAGYAMAAAGSLGLAHTFMERGHVRMDLIVSRLAAPARTWADIAALLVTAALVGFAAWYLCRLVLISWRLQDRSAGSDGLLLWMVQLPIAIGFVVFGLAILHCTVLAFADRPGPPGPRASDRNG